MQTGVIKFFNVTKGFGFIKDENSNEEIFVHISGLTEDVQENDRVSYDVVDGRKGQNAVNVKRI